MRLKLVTGPTEEPIALSEAMAHMRVTETDEDLLVTALIRAAREHVEHDLGRVLMTQTWDVLCDGFPASDEIVLPVSPVQSVTSVSYVDGAGTTTTFSGASWTLDTSAIRARVLLGYGQSWPVTRKQINAVTVRCVAGYASAEAVPQGIKQWMLLSIAKMFEFREPLVTGSVTPLGFVDALLDPYRIPRIG